MTLTDYAKYLLNVCGKRFTHLYQRHYLDSTPALPSLSALLSSFRTLLQSTYSYLQSRLQGDPTSGIPSVPLTPPLTLVNLLPNLQKLATRKIDAGTSTQIPDGISLVRLLCDTTAASAVTELIDTNTGYTMDGNVRRFAEFPNLTKLTLRCKEIYANTRHIFPLVGLSELYLPELEKFRFLNGVYGENIGLLNNGTVTSISMPKLKEIIPYSGSMVANNCQCYMFYNCNNLKEILMPSLTKLWCSYFTTAPLEKYVVGTLETDFMTAYTQYSAATNTANLIHFEIGQGVAVSLHLNWWQPTLTDANRATFLSNFMQYIATRLANRTGQTTLRLTLSQAVRDVLTSEIEHEIVDIRNWEISPAKSV